MPNNMFNQQVKHFTRKNQILTRLPLPYHHKLPHSLLWNKLWLLQHLRWNQGTKEVLLWEFKKTWKYPLSLAFLLLMQGLINYNLKNVSSNVLSSRESWMKLLCETLFGKGKVIVGFNFFYFIVFMVFQPRIIQLSWTHQ